VLSHRLHAVGLGVILSAVLDIKFRAGKQAFAFPDPIASQ